MDDRRVAEADVDGRRAPDALQGAVERPQAVLPRLLGPRLHVRLVDLDDVGARGEEVADLLVHGDGVVHRRRLVARIVVVLRLLAHRERPRHGHLDRLRRVGAKEPDVVDLDGVPAPHRPHDARDRVRMAGPVQRGAGVVEVDALERGGEAIRVALPPDLAVGEDVEPRRLLRADRQQRRVVLRFAKPRLPHPPQLARPHAGREAAGQALAVDQPIGLRIAADERGGKEHGVTPSEWIRTRASARFGRSIAGVRRIGDARPHRRPPGRAARAVIW